MLKNNDNENYYCFKPQTSFESSEGYISKDNPIIKWFSEHNECITRETLSYVPMFKAMWEHERKALSNLDIDVIVPVKCRNSLIGMLLISKKDNNYGYNLG
jgi:hypothetical protein